MPTVTDQIDAILVDLRTDVGCLLMELNPLAAKDDRARQQLDRLVRVQCALADASTEGGNDEPF